MYPSYYKCIFCGSSSIFKNIFCYLDLYVNQTQSGIKYWLIVWFIIWLSDSYYLATWRLIWWCLFECLLLLWLYDISVPVNHLRLFVMCAVVPGFYDHTCYAKALFKMKWSKQQGVWCTVSSLTCAWRNGYKI